MLGISEGAVRMRIKRGTLDSTRVHDRLYVLLDAEPHTDPTRSDTDRLISTLEEQLALEREAHAEARRLLAAALERIPAIEPPETPETPFGPGPNTQGPPKRRRTIQRRPSRRPVRGGGGYSVKPRSHHLWGRRRVCFFGVHSHRLQTNVCAPPLYPILHIYLV